MELAKILDSLSEDSAVEKTASDSSAENKLTEALNDAVAAVETGSEKVASVQTDDATPSDDLTKIASRLATAEQEALVKEAEIYGAALCDGFMSRMSQYEGQPGSEKVASADSFEKFASENPDLVKQAADLGYRETRQQLEKVANDSYAQGYYKTAELVKAAAEDCAQRGMQDTYTLLAKLNK